MKSVFSSLGVSRVRLSALFQFSLLSSARDALRISSTFFIADSARASPPAAKASPPEVKASFPASAAPVIASVALVAFSLIASPKFDSSNGICLLVICCDFFEERDFAVWGQFFCPSAQSVFVYVLEGFDELFPVFDFVFHEVFDAFLADFVEEFCAGKFDFFLD